MSGQTTYVDAQGNLVSTQTDKPASPAAGTTGSAPAAGSSSSSQSGTLAGQAASQGLPASPATPAGAASIGASPDAAKMAGTPSAEKGTLGADTQKQQGGTGEKSVSGTGVAAPTQTGEQTQQSEADRRASLQPGQMSQQDAEAEARRQQMQQAYGEVGLGVADMITAALKQSAGNAAGASYVVPDSATLASSVNGFGGLSADQQSSVTSALQNAATLLDSGDASKSADALVAVQQAMQAAGMDPANIPTTVSGLQSLLTQQSVGQTTAAQLEDHLQLTPDALAQMGVTPSDLAMLGLSPQQVQGMSLGDFQTRVRDALQASTQNVSSLQAQLNDPNLDPNTRAQIEQQLASLNQGGAAGSTRATNNLLSSGRIASANDTISIGGTNYTVDQMLDDKNISNLITQYVTSGAGSDLQKEVDQQFPQLAQFIQQNQAQLTKAAATMQRASSTVSAAETANNNLSAQIASNLGAPGTEARDQFDTLMKQIDPNWGSAAQKFTTKTINQNESGVLQMLANPAQYGFSGPNGTATTADGTPGVTPKQFLQELTTLGQMDPDQAKQVMKMSPAEIQAAGLTSASTLTHFVQGLQQQRVLQSGDMNQIMSTFFPSEKGNQQAVMGAIAARQIFGDATPAESSLFSTASLYGGMSADTIAGALKSVTDGAAHSVSDLQSGKQAGTGWVDPKQALKSGNEAQLADILAQNDGAIPDVAHGGNAVVDQIVAMDPANSTGLLTKLLNSGIPIDGGEVPRIQQAIQRAAALNGVKPDPSQNGPQPGGTQQPGVPGAPSNTQIAQKLAPWIANPVLAQGQLVDKASGGAIGRALSRL